MVNGETPHLVRGPCTVAPCTLMMPSQPRRNIMSESQPTGADCIVDPESYWYMAPNGKLHAHVYDNDTGLSLCSLNKTCEVCGLPAAACECMGPRTCPRCGSPDLREVVVSVEDEHVDLACIDCTWRQRIGGGT